MIGQVIGNYRIVSELGKGGMGMVYRAEHTQLGRPAALKMLLPQLSNDPGIVQRFFNEARAASAIDHPGIVEIYELGTHTDGRAYFVMALLKGESLAARLEHGPLPPLEGAAIVAQVVSVIAAAHACGIVHRDLKPDNIFLVPNEMVAGGTQVKLLDFGIAKLADEQGGGLKTQTGMLIGTPAYMSPEQCMGKSDLDHRTDLYALGCILFHVLCGRPPFTSPLGTGVLIAAQLRDAPPDPRSLDPRIPDALAAITLRLLEKDPDARFQSALDLRAALVAAGVAAPTTIVRAAGGPAPGIGSLASTRRYVPEAYGATTAPTTSSGSAAQLVSAPAPASKRAYWIVGGLLLSIGAVGVFAVVSGHDAGGGSNTVATTQPPPPPATPAPPPPLPSARPETVPAELPPAVQTECAPGQARTDDTRGHCCWPGQAWSSSKDRCVGAPTCPAGQRASREQCLVNPAEVQPARVRTIAPSAAPELSLDAKSYPPGSDIHIRFSAPISAPSTSRAWIAISDPAHPPSSYGVWKFVDDGARTVTLRGPTPNGAYEVRLYTEYPAKTFNIARVAPFAVDPKVEAPDPPSDKPGATPRAQQRFIVSVTHAAGGETVELRFPVAMRALPGESYWVTTVKAGDPDSAWGSYAYVKEGAKSTTLKLPSEPGDAEIRLHANYPKKTTNVVHRVPIRIDPK